jgi:peptide/nickel transport system substrate-binding protein
MNRFGWMMALGLATAGTAALGAPAHAQTLRIGMQDDPDALDPVLSRTFVGRIVLGAMCDKLVDISPDLKFVPQLALSWETAPDGKALTFKLRPGVKFHDGEPFDAEAVKFNIERSLTFPGTQRKSEIGSVASVDVIDPLTVRLNLSAPSVPLMAQLSDRAGMMVSPKAAKTAGADFSAHPVCAGAYKFVERVPQDRIAVERFADYWAKERITIPRITYHPIPDTTVRLANLQSGQLDMIERLQPTDLDAVKKDGRFGYSTITSLGYNGITFNIANTEAVNPAFKDARVRRALELAIDRDVINQVVYNGVYEAGNQPVSPANPYYAKSVPIPARDVAKAKSLLKEAGQPSPTLTLLVPNNNEALQIAQIIQSMAAEAGITIKITGIEFATMLDQAQKGNFEAELIAWSGRIDPDGNIYTFWSCKGALNDGKYCNPDLDRLLDEARVTGDSEKRVEIYGQAFALEAKDLSILYFNHQKWIHVFTKKLEGYKPYPDGLIRIYDLKLNS